jgi:hypothetical protein
MGTYRQPAIIDEAAGLKQANAEISKFNESLTDFADAEKTRENPCYGLEGEELTKCQKKTEDDNAFKKLQEDNQNLLQQLEKKQVNASQNTVDSMMVSDLPGNKNDDTFKNILLEAKKKFVQYSVEGDKMAAQKTLNLGNTIKGTMTGLKSFSDDITKAMKNPSGGPNSINTHLINNDIFKMGSEMIFDPKLNGFEAELSEDGFGISFGLKESSGSRFDMEKFNSQLLDPNSPPLIPTIGDVSRVSNSLIATKKDQPSIIDKTFEINNIKPNDKGRITFEEGNSVLNEFVSNDNDSVLNDQNFSASIWPSAISKTLGVYSSIKDLDDAELDPMQLKIKTIWDSNLISKNPVEDFQKNGAGFLGKWIGSSVSQDSANSKEVIFQREIANTFINNDAAEKALYPMIDIKPIPEPEYPKVQEEVTNETAGNNDKLMETNRRLEELKQDQIYKASDEVVDSNSSEIAESDAEYNSDEKLNIID